MSNVDSETCTVDEICCGRKEEDGCKVAELLRRPGLSDVNGSDDPACRARSCRRMR